MAYNKELVQMLLEAGVEAEEAIRLSVGVKFDDAAEIWEQDETS